MCYYRPGTQLQALTGLLGGGDETSRTTRQSAHEGGQIVSPAQRPDLVYRRYHWYSFLLKDETTPGPQSGRKDWVNEKFQ